MTTFADLNLKQLKRMKQTAVLFDLDGVLIDTETQYSIFWKRMGEEFCPEIKDFNILIKGKTLVQIYDQYFTNQLDVQALITEKLNDFENHMDFPLIAGGLDFVDALRNAGYKVGVVTSSNQAKMKCLFEHHSDFTTHFDRIFTAEDALRSKPAPDCYLSAARFFGFDASQCYVFEDSLSGLQAGHDSGATVIGLTTTYPADRIAPLCHHIINDFTHFTVDLMENLNNKLCQDI